MSARKLLVQVYSDIHIELWNKIPELPVKAKYLFLAGDICNQIHPLFYPFFDYCSSNWEKVFYISGNHEYYVKNNNAYEEILSRHANIIFITDYQECDKINSIILPENKSYADLLCVIPLQMLAYKLSIKRGINPDMPQNLAKVVTVE